MKLRWFIPIALLIPLRLGATDAAVGAVKEARSSLSASFVATTTTTLAASRTGGWRRRIPLIRLKMLALIPIPIPKVSTAITVNAGLFASVRKP